jgi:hypothetical protein
MQHASSFVRPLVAVSCLTIHCIAFPTASAAAQMQIILPLERVAYQTNELIDLSIMRSSEQALPAGDLSLKVNGDDGSKLAFTFALPAANVEDKDARRTDHLHLDGRLLRPGRYSVEAMIGNLTASTSIEVYSHVRRSDFKLIDWGSSAHGKEQAVLGADSMGFNLLYVTQLSKDDSIRGGCDFMQNCAMGGAHQIDIHMENDWSDPYVLQGGEARVVRQALKDRSMPNCMGVHFYDEPGLTWWKDPRTGVMVPFNIPAQDRSYKSAFDAQAPQYDQVKPDDSAAVARWDQLNRWKLSFMEAAWKDAQFGVSSVQGNLLSVTQSEYAWNAYADGYYFNVVRPLPAISGHGGYDDGPAGYLYPSFHHEFGRMRDLNKPEWYLPTWYGVGTDNWRLEQYLSFMTGLEGMAKPPDYKIQNPESTKGADGIVETNKLFARLGTIFTKMPVTRPPVAQLYSISQDLGAEVRDMQDPSAINTSAYEGGHHNRAKSLQTYLAGKAIHVPLFPIVEEDVLDGTLAAHHKAVVLPGIDTLAPKVVAALEAYIAGGGVVLVSDDSKVQIKGATKLGVPVDVSQYDLVNKLWSTDQKESTRQRSARLFLKSAEPLAKALKEKLEAIGVTPDLDADSPQIVTSKQSAGDIDYLFAVNATGDENGSSMLDIKSARARLSLPADGRPLYDAVHGGESHDFTADAGKLAGEVRFGPGQMRVWARTARPIGGVQVQTPVLFSDYTVAADPLRIDAQAVLMDNSGQVLGGVAPMEIRLIDPLGQVRYDLYRACDRGVLRIDLPMAVNDPAGEWRLSVRELLNDTEGHATFSYKPPSQAGAAAGATRRAVYFGNFSDNDRDHVFRFFRQFHDVTIVKGPKDYESAAADRIVTVLKPWDVQCKVIDAKDAAKPRELTPEESAAWAGLEGSLGPKATEKPGPHTVGFAVRGPVLLVGTPEDNPLIKFELEQHFLTYKPDAENFPGGGRGYLSWQRDAVSYGNESVTLIAYDGAGMSEAVGSMYEAAAGLDPLTRYELPESAAVTPASRATAPPEATVAWRAVVPDRVISLQTNGDGVTVYTADGSATKVDQHGKVSDREDLAGKAPPVPAKAGAAPAGALLPDHVVKRVAAGGGGGLTAIGYWGGEVQIVAADGATRSLTRVRGDVSDIAWLDGTLVVGTSDGEVVGIRP